MSTTTTWWQTISALWTASFHAHWRMPWSVFWRLSELAVIGIMLVFLNDLIESPQLSHRLGAPYLPWALIGYAMVQLFDSGARSLSLSVSYICSQGWVEGLQMSGASWSKICVGLSSYGWSQATSRALIVLTGAWWAIGWDGSFIHALYAGLILLPSLLVFGACGWLFAAIAIRFGRSESISRFILVLSLVLCGVFYPREVLAPPAAFIGAWLPLGPALDGARAALLDGVPPWEQLDVLIRQCVQLMLVPAAMLAMDRAHKFAQHIPLLGNRWQG